MFRLSFQIWTSTRRRAHHTAWPFLQAAQSNPSQISAPSQDEMNALLEPPSPISPSVSGHSVASSSTLNVKVVEKPQMSEINPGVWDGLSPDQARKYYPEDWERFSKDPYSFRAPRAESYHDLSGMHRLLS